MRKYEKPGDFSVNAISGTYVVILAINAPQNATRGLLGFGIHRTDHTEDEQYWLKGFKTFEATEPDPVPGRLYSTLEHPVQSFLWADYTAKPDHEYTYKVVPLFGLPTDPQQGPSVKVRLAAESEDEGAHAIYFNRGVAASQAYFTTFGNKNPDEVEGYAAYKWLSRGLEEAILRFIGRAAGPQYALRASVYEFNYDPVLQKFRSVARTGADVKIVYDSRRENPREANDEAIDRVGIRDLVKRRTRPKSYISHNKFIVLLRNGRPLEVWTGSVNFTKGGIFGQSNVGHIVRDEQVATKYHDYWLQLWNDPTNRDLRKWVERETPDPSGAPQAGITAIFSPRRSLRVLEWYAERMDAATQTVCLTAAFGVSPVLKPVLEEDKDYLRYLLLEKRGRSYDLRAGDRDLQIAAGAAFTRGALNRWAREKLTDFNFHVRYVHTKFMLLDPLTENPTVISGSANFSKASTKNNDENMLVTQGNKRVADIYLGEFLRLFNHFYFREIVNRQRAERGTEERRRSYLRPDDSWTRRYYIPGSIKEKQRLLFGRDLTQPSEC